MRNQHLNQREKDSQSFISTPVLPPYLILYKKYSSGYLTCNPFCTQWYANVCKGERAWNLSLCFKFHSSEDKLIGKINRLINQSNQLTRAANIFYFAWSYWTLSAREGCKSNKLMVLCCCLVTKLCPTLFLTPIDCSQVPLFMGFPRQEYLNGLPFSLPGGLPSPGIKPLYPTLTGRFLTTETQGKSLMVLTNL